MKKADITKKATNLGMAAGAGMLTGYVTKNAAGWLDKAGIKDVNDKLIQGAPLVGAFFLLGTNKGAYDAAAYGIAGACGVGLGQSFGIFDDINGPDDINGLFDEPADVRYEG